MQVCRSVGTFHSCPDRLLRLCDPGCLQPVARDTPADFLQIVLIALVLGWCARIGQCLPPAGWRPGASALKGGYKAGGAKLVGVLISAKGRVRGRVLIAQEHQPLPPNRDLQLSLHPALQESLLGCLAWNIFQVREFETIIFSSVDFSMTGGANRNLLSVNHP